MIRGSVGYPGKRSCEVLLTGMQGTLDRRSVTWSFEVTGPGSIYAKSSYVFKSSQDAMRMAEHMARAILDANPSDLANVAAGR